MKARVLKGYDSDTNDFKYSKDEIIEVTEVYGFNNSYAIFHNLEQCNVLDWIPKKLVEII